MVNAGLMRKPIPFLKTRRLMPTLSRPLLQPRACRSCRSLSRSSPHRDFDLSFGHETLVHRFAALAMTAERW